MPLITPRFPERYRKYGEYLGINIPEQIAEINQIHDEINFFELNHTHNGHTFSEEQRKLCHKERDLYWFCKNAISALGISLKKVPELDFNRGINLPHENLHLKVKEGLSRYRQLKEDVKNWWNENIVEKVKVGENKIISFDDVLMFIKNSNEITDKEKNIAFDFLVKLFNRPDVERKIF